MSLETFKAVIDFFSAENVDDFRLTGGEPTIHPEFEAVLDFLSARKIAPRLITNGIRLMQMRSPELWLDKVSRCWISVYGINDDQHRAIGGAATRPLRNVMEFTGHYTRQERAIGISALLTEVDLSELKRFVAQAIDNHVRHLRFLFAEPDGRAAQTSTIFRANKDLREQALEIVELLRSFIAAEALDFLSINDPFGLGMKNPTGEESCLLKTRRMWSVSPEGGVYSCCFNTYDPAHRAHWNLITHEPRLPQTNEELVRAYAPICRGLKASWWRTNHPCTCPISAITLIDHSPLLNGIDI